jgi:hypothetical protein
MACNRHGQHALAARCCAAGHEPDQRPARKLPGCSLPECKLPGRNWAGAAKRTERSATQGQESPRTDSDVIHATPQLQSDATDPPAPATTHGPAPSLADWLAGIRAWLAAVRHRFGGLLFLAADEEARWRDWHVTERWGGLARDYRDARFGPRLVKTAE